MDWLKKLSDLPSERVFVQHQPETPRYGRARSKLRYLRMHGRVLGSRMNPINQAPEIAVWTPPSTGSGHGYYACFRFVQSDFEGDSAILFCFYDGTERSPGFRSLGAAQVYAHSHGFREDPSDEHPG